MTIEIKHRVTGAVLYSSKAATFRDALIEAVRANAYLAGANLAGAYLVDADLAGAYLVDADLAGANLVDANLAGAYLVDADLAGAIYKRPEGMPEAAVIRAAVARKIREHPELHDQAEWGDGSANPACDTPCCVAGWACHLGGGDYGLSVRTAASIMLYEPGKPTPSFSANATRDEILAALEA